MRKNKIIFIISLVTLGVFLLYWFQWQPNSIRKSCAEEVVSKHGYGSTANNLYRLCLVKHLMKPESLFVK